MDQEDDNNNVILVNGEEGTPGNRSCSIFMATEKARQGNS